MSSTRSTGIRIDQSFTQSVGNQFGGVAAAGLAHHAGAMAIDGLDTDAKRFADLSIGATGDHLAENLTFAISERLKVSGFFEHASEAAAHDPPAFEDARDSAQDFAHIIGFAKHPIRSDIDQLRDLAARIDAGENDHACFGRPPSRLEQHLCPSGVRHGHIEHQQFRTVLAHSDDGVDPVVGRLDNFEALALHHVFVSERGSERIANDRVVIRNHGFADRSNPSQTLQLARPLKHFAFSRLHRIQKAMGRKSVLNRGRNRLATLLLFCLAFFAAPAMAGTDPPVMVEPGISQEMVEGSARYLVAKPGREIGVEAALAAYEAGQFEFEFPPDGSGTIRDWRVWMALPFESASPDGTAGMRKVLGIGGIFAELPRVYLTCGGEEPREILASQSVEGGELSARYFTYVRTQSFALAPGDKCLALLNLATSDNPNLGIFREGELGTRQVIAVLLKGAVTAILLIIGLILAITSYVTARPLGIYLGAAYSLAMLQNETILFASLLAESPAAGREFWENVTILTVFAMVSTFLFGFREDLRLKVWWKRLLAALVLSTPAIIIARTGNETSSLVWTLYVSMFLAALTVVFRLDIGRWLRTVAGAILFAGAIGVIWTEPYLGGRYLTDLTIEWFRDFFRIVSGLGVLVLMLVDIVGSRRERDRMVTERIDSLETQAETDRRLLETEREYARARDAANRTKAQLAAASHDIRQPIVGLRAAVASEAERLSPGLQSRLGEAIDYLEHLTREYSDRTNTPASAETEELGEPYSVDLITNAVGNMFEGEARQAGIKLTVSGCDCQTRVPALALIRATSNLVANALRHAEPSAVKITATSEDGYCQIRVVDDGKGMDAGTLAKSQLEGRKSDTSDGDGLGLAIVHDLASRHELDFTLSSSPDSGTVCVISIVRDSV